MHGETVKFPQGMPTLYLAAHDMLIVIINIKSVT